VCIGQGQHTSLLCQKQYNKRFFLIATTTEGKRCNLFSVACPLMANALAYSTAAVCILFKLRHMFDLFESLKSESYNKLCVFDKDKHTSLMPKAVITNEIFLSTTKTEGKCCNLFSVVCSRMGNALAYSTAAVCILFKLRHTFYLCESLEFVKI
jgi:hypothetical protein